MKVSATASPNNTRRQWRRWGYSVAPARVLEKAPREPLSEVLLLLPQAGAAVVTRLERVNPPCSLRIPLSRSPGRLAFALALSLALARAPALACAYASSGSIIPLPGDSR